MLTSDNSKISWCDATWNPVIGCSKISAGCKNCFAERMACRLRCINPMSDHSEVISYKPMPAHWNGKTVFIESALTKPLHWRKPRKIFVVSMGDLFHESVPFDWIDRVFAVMALCPQHEFKVLTKRAGRMREYCTDTSTARADNRGKIVAELGYTGPLECLNFDHVHKGVTVENQKNVGRIADLIGTPAAKRFLSLEPRLPGELSFRWLLSAHETTGETYRQYLERTGSYSHYEELQQIDYAFIGCESGPRARLCSLDNIRHTMHQCREAGVKIHIKQIPLDGKCNKNFDEWPPEFRIREI